jgi:hypothetical protein
MRYLSRPHRSVDVAFLSSPLAIDVKGERALSISIPPEALKTVEGQPSPGIAPFYFGWGCSF